MTGIFDDSRIPQRIMQLREGDYEMERLVNISGEPMVHRAKITFFDDAGGVKFDNMPASRCPRCGGDDWFLSYYDLPSHV